MPIYEYECGNCGHRLEAFQKISDEALTRCPECQEDQLRKLISAAAFHLKGSGWYVTDFRDKPKTGDKNDKASTSEDTKQANKKQETGPDTSSVSPDSKKGTETRKTETTGKSTTTSE